MTRTFIAIELNEETRNYLSQEIRRFSQALPQVRWSDPATLHLTLAFLGELDERQLARATDAAVSVAAQTKPFTLSIGSPGIFGPAQAPRVIWIGVAGNLQSLLDLQSGLAARLAENGFPPEDRAYAPHLTLARIKAPLTSQEMATLRRLIGPTTSGNDRPHPSSPSHHQGITIPVQHLSVMKSDLLRTGPRYTCLQLCPFSC